MPTREHTTSRMFHATWILLEYMQMSCELKYSPEFLRPRRRCCSGVRAIVEGAIVYLKYFQKSKTAFKLNRVAKTSSVTQKTKKHS